MEWQAQDRKISQGNAISLQGQAKQPQNTESQNGGRSFSLRRTQIAQTQSEATPAGKCLQVTEPAGVIEVAGKDPGADRDGGRLGVLAGLSERGGKAEGEGKQQTQTATVPAPHEVHLTVLVIIICFFCSLARYCPASAASF